MKIEDLEKALQYFVIAVPESEEQAKAYFWARKALAALRSMPEAGEPLTVERLRELVNADRDGRCAVLPVKPGGMVRFSKNPRAKHEKVDCISIYSDGKIMLGFHEVGMKETWVDNWSEDEAEKYVSVEATSEDLRDHECSGLVEE